MTLDGLTGDPDTEGAEILRLIEADVAAGILPDWVADLARERLREEADERKMEQARRLIYTMER